MKNDNEKLPLLVFFGHHKAASSWIESIIFELCLKMGLKHSIVDRRSLHNNTLEYPIGYFRTKRKYSPGTVIDDLGKFAEQNNIDFLTYTNAELKYAATLSNFKGFHVVRDPRDIVVSAYFSHLFSHPTSVWPELIEHRQELEKLSLDEGLFLEMECRRKEFEDMKDWDYTIPEIYEIKMEDLTVNPEQVFIKVFSFLGLLDKSKLNLSNRIFYSIGMSLRQYFNYQDPIRQIPLEVLLKVLENRSYNKITRGRKKGEENIKSHYRKGVAGDWKNYFKDEHIKYFKENYNELLVKLQYESDDSW